MHTIVIAASAILSVPPQVAYGILIDYRDGHPSILPRPHFGELSVESGGTGEGTVFRVQTRQATGMQTLRMRATEPQPGRVLVENDLDSDLVTTFTVDPVDGGKGCRVTIETRWTRGGVRGWMERVLLPPLARPVFLREIRNLEALGRERMTAAVQE
jgi:hypothetical protein